MRLADFGLATFANPIVPRITRRYVGNAPWMAPELLCPQMFGAGADDYWPTTSTDVYSLAFLCWEVRLHEHLRDSYRLRSSIFVKMYTLLTPFHLSGPGEVLLRVICHERPERPTASRHGMEMSDTLWNLVELCWYAVAAPRPGIDDIVTILTP